MRIILSRWGKEHPITFSLSRYAENGNLRVALITHEDGYPEPWSTLTVNLRIKCEENCAFIDINNNGREIISWLLENNLGLLTGREIRSGFCVYPEFIFFPDELLKYTTSGADILEREMVK